MQKDAAIGQTSSAPGPTHSAAPPPHAAAGLSGPGALAPRTRALLWALLGASVCAALWPIRLGEFVYDDLWLVAQNPSLQSFGQMWASLGGSYWDFLDARSAEFVGYWRPLTTLALYLGQTLGGGDPAGFHALSLALHVAATVLAFELARRLSRDTAIGFCAALLFGLHPVQVEPVAWISSINDPLAGLFSLAALLAFHAWRERGSAGLPVGAAAWFACALLAKESALAVLPLVLAVDVARAVRDPRPLPLVRRMQPLLWPYATLLVAALAYWGARIAVFGDPWAGFDRSTGHLGLTAGRDFSLRLELLGGALHLLAWPARLNLFRDTRPEIPWSDPALLIAIGCIALLLALIAIAWRRRAGTALAGLLIIPAALSPAVLRIEALGRFSLSERYLYVSVFGFALCLAWFCVEGARRAGLRRLGWLAVLLFAAAYGWRSHARTAAWRDETALFTRSFADNPKSPYVAWGYGRVLLGEYKRTYDLELLKAARIAFEHSLNLGLKREDGTRDPEVLVTEEDRLQANLGYGWYWFFAALRNHDEATLEEALGILEKTRSFFPSSYEATTATGVVMMQQGNLAGAKARFEKALELNPKDLEAWYHLGDLQYRRGDLKEARLAFERALALKRDDADTLPRYAAVLVELGETDAARAVYDRALAIAPENPAVLMGLGNLAAQQRDGASAVAWFDRVLGIDPTFAPAHLQKGRVLAMMGQPQRALGELQRACELAPNDFETNRVLAEFLVAQGMGKDALPFFEHALALRPDDPRSGEIRAQIELLRAQ